MSNQSLLFVPGLNCTAALWTDQIQALGARRAVIVADHTGHDSMPALAAAVLEAAPPRFALAGLSMGGYLALEIVRTAPERVERLALLDTQARPESAEAREKRLAIMEIARKGGFSRIADMQIPQLLSERGQGDERLKAIVRGMASATGVEAFLRQETAILARADQRPMLGRIGVPTLVLVGEEDKLTPPELALEMHQGIAGSRLATIPGAGHLSTIDAPERVTAALRDWLDA